MLTIQEDGSLLCNLDGTKLTISRPDGGHIRIAHKYGDMVLSDKTAIPLALAILRYTLTSLGLRVKYALLVLLGGLE